MFTSQSFIILGSIIGVGAVSMSGISLLILKEKLLRKIMIILIGFSTGALLGDVFLHMLPEMVEEGEVANYSWFLILAGIVTCFILEKFIHWHHCHGMGVEEDTHHHHHHHHVGIMSVIGDMLHNALDGILIAGSFLVSTEVGIATTIAVVLHEIPQEIGDVGILLHSGYSKKQAIMLNGLTGLASIAGALLVIIFESRVPSVGAALMPFAAGNFLYIAGSDLIPELHKETGAKRSTIQLVSLLAGIAFMAALMLME